MKTCETCKHWNVWFSPNGVEIGECLGKHIILNREAIDKTKWKTDSVGVPISYATNPGKQPYMEPLWCGKDYGCVHHEERFSAAE